MVKKEYSVYYKLLVLFDVDSPQKNNNKKLGVIRAKTEIKICVF